MFWLYGSQEFTGRFCACALYLYCKQNCLVITLTDVEKPYRNKVHAWWYAKFKISESRMYSTWKKTDLQLFSININLQTASCTIYILKHSHRTDATLVKPQMVLKRNNCWEGLVGLCSMHSLPNALFCLAADTLRPWRTGIYWTRLVLSGACWLAQCTNFKWSHMCRAKILNVFFRTEIRLQTYSGHVHLFGIVDNGFQW